MRVPEGKSIITSRLLVCAYVFLFLLLGAVGYKGIVQTQKSIRKYDEITDNLTYKFSLILDLHQRVERLQAMALRHLLPGDVLSPEERKKIEGERLGIRQSCQAYEMLINKPQERLLFEKMLACQKSNAQVLSQLMQLDLRKFPDAKAFDSTFKKNNREFWNSLSSLSAYLQQEIKVKDAEADFYLLHSHSIINLLMGLVTVFLLVLGITIFKAVKKLYGHNRTLKERDKRLEEQKQLFEGLLEAAPDGIMGMDEQGRIVFFNKQAQKLFGYSNAEIIGQPVDKLVPQPYRNGHNSQMSGYKQKPSNRRFGDMHRELFGQRSDGTVFPVDIGLNMLTTQQGKLVIAIIRDITERKQFEQSLRQSEYLYKNIFNNTPLPKAVCDKHTLQFYEVNDTALKHYGYSREEVLNMTIFDIRLEDDHDEVRTQLQAKNYVANKSIRRHRKKNGEIIFVEAAIREINYLGKEAYLFTIHDVTEKVRLQNRLLNEKLNKQKEVTRASINAQEKERHEIGKELHDNVNQLLASARLYLEATLVRAGEKEEFINRSIKLIASGMEEIRKLSKSLVPPSLGDRTLQESISDLVGTINIINDREIYFDARFLEEELLSDGLKVTIYRIIQEQLNNIIKYAEAEKIEILLQQEGAHLMLSIRDNGKGFSLDARRNGIGLTNIINRAETYNGTAVIDTAPGKGCTLTVRFQLFSPAMEPDHIHDLPMDGIG